MIIKNAFVLTDDFKFNKCDVKINGEIIERTGSFSENGTDGDGMYLIPGFIDSHMHSAMGKNFIDCGEDTFKTVASYKASKGTTTIVPTLSAAPHEKMIKAIDAVKKFYGINIDGCAAMGGIHLEGPFFSVKYKGAHKPENIRNCDIEEFKKLYDEAEGSLKIMTLAPELPGTEEVVRYATEKGVVISAGHTNATFEEISQGIEWGITQGTHLYNAMSPLNHRNPGAVGALLQECIKAELICDFFHVHPKVVEYTYKVKGADKINMITDSEVGTGLPDGVYSVQNAKIIVKDRHTYLENGTIAGGTSDLYDCYKNMAGINIPLEEISVMASKNPAETLGIYNEVGSITEGKRADLLLLDKELNLKKIILRGKELKID